MSDSVGLARDPSVARDLEAFLDRVDTLGLMVLDAEERLRFANAWLAQRWRGGALEPGAKMTDLWSPSPRFLRAIRACIERGNPARLSHYLNPQLFPLSHPLSPEQTLPQSVSVRPGPRDQNGRSTCLIDVRDVSLEVDREATLRAQIEEIAAANRMLELFVAAASHDLRGPFLRIISGLEIAREEIEDAGLTLPEEAGEAFDWIDQSLETAKNLLDNLMIYCRLGAQTMTAAPISPRGIINEILTMNGVPEGFAVEISPDLPLLFASEAEVTLILRNLIMNAITHHHLDRGLVEITGGQAEGTSWICIADDGPGIPVEKRAEILKPMVRLSSNGGSGLGLAMINRTIICREGWLEISDRPDGASGSCFRFGLPIPG